MWAARASHEYCIKRQFFRAFSAAGQGWLFIQYGSSRAFASLTSMCNHREVSAGLWLGQKTGATLDGAVALHFAAFISFLWFSPSQSCFFATPKPLLHASQCRCWFAWVCQQKRILNSFENCENCAELHGSLA